VTTSIFSVPKGRAQPRTSVKAAASKDAVFSLEMHVRSEPDAHVRGKVITTKPSAISDRGSTPRTLLTPLLINDRIKIDYLCPRLW